MGVPNVFLSRGLQKERERGESVKGEAVCQSGKRNKRESKREREAEAGGQGGRGNGRVLPAMAKSIAMAGYPPDGRGDSGVSSWLWGGIVFGLGWFGFSGSEQQLIPARGFGDRE